MVHSTHIVSTQQRVTNECGPDAKCCPIDDLAGIHLYCGELGDVRSPLWHDSQEQYLLIIGGSYTACNCVVSNNKNSTLKQKGHQSPICCSDGKSAVVNTITRGGEVYHVVNCGYAQKGQGCYPYRSYCASGLSCIFAVWRCG